MRRRFTLLPGLGLAIALVLVPRADSRVEGAPLAATPLGSAFTYQGQLKQNGQPVTGPCDFQFSLYDAATGGTQVGTTHLVNGVAVTGGLFTVTLDFGANTFNGDARWLQLGTGCPSGMPPTLLSPRQPVTPAPNALALPGLYTQPNATSPNLIGGFDGNSVTAGVVAATIAGGGASGNANRVTDDYGTVAGGQNNQAGDNAGTPSDRRFATVGGGQNNTASGDTSTVAGGHNNTASASDATVGGGGANMAGGPGATVGAGLFNAASALLATVGGGAGNTATAQSTTVAGGFSNAASGNQATVGGGQFNTASGPGATVGGGQNNTASAQFATIAGGGPADTANTTTTNNRVTDDYGTIGGGGGNRAGNANGATFATVGGGQNNTASGQWDTVGGGQSNTADGEWAAVGGGLGNRASGGTATVPGGDDNLALGNSSFAAGQLAQALDGGTFVWADQSQTVFASNTNLGAGAGQFPLQPANSFHIRATGGARVVTNVGSTTGVWIGPGGTSWNSGSHSSLKGHFAPVDGRGVLERLAAMPIATWSLDSEDPSIRHMGPMAEAFWAAYGLGYGDAWINQGDADGVAFAAIQGLYQLAQEQDAQLAALRAQLSGQAAEQEQLEARLAALERTARP